MKEAKEINENEWLSLNAKNQSLKIGHLQKIKAPEDLLELRSDLKAVESKLTNLIIYAIFFCETQCMYCLK